MNARVRQVVCLRRLFLFRVCSSIVALIARMTLDGDTKKWVGVDRLSLVEKDDLIHSHTVNHIAHWPTNQPFLSHDIDCVSSTVVCSLSLTIWTLCVSVSLLYRVCPSFLSPEHWLPFNICIRSNCWCCQNGCVSLSNAQRCGWDKYDILHNIFLSCACASVMHREQLTSGANSERAVKIRINQREMTIVAHSSTSSIECCASLASAWAWTYYSQTIARFSLE